jgi:hypothetical protein
MPATDDDTTLPFSLPNLCKKKVTAAFDGGQISSDGGVLLLAGADKRLGLIDTLSALIPDDRDPLQITHSMADILRGRIFAIACGYPDGNDLDDLRHDPAFMSMAAWIRVNPAIRRSDGAPGDAETVAARWWPSDREAVRFGQGGSMRRGRSCCSGWNVP